MFLDFITELFNDYSPMYFYFSLILSVLCSIQWMPVVTKDVYRDARINLASFQKEELQRASRNSSTNEVNKRRDWLAITTRRITIPDDKEEGASSSYFNKWKQKRGGTTCKNNQHSLSYGKQVLLESLV